MTDEITLEYRDAGKLTAAGRLVTPVTPSRELLSLDGRGSVDGGTAFGNKDDYGSEAVECPVPIHDRHATATRLPGLGHEKLAYRYSGSSCSSPT